MKRIWWLAPKILEHAESVHMQAIARDYDANMCNATANAACVLFKVRRLLTVEKSLE
jgi:hypothetical protein